MESLTSLWDSYWWIFPLILMILCCFGTWGRKGSGICGFGSRDIETGKIRSSDSANDILDKRYASGEISREEYEERKRAINQARS